MSGKRLLLSLLLSSLLSAPVWAGTVNVGGGGTSSGGGGGSGDVTDVGNCSSGSCLTSSTTQSDPSITFNSPTASDTDFWMGIQEEGGGDDDDTLQIGKGTTLGTTPRLVMDGSGALSLGDGTPDTTPDTSVEIAHTTSNTGSNPTFSLTDADIAHSITAQAETGTLFRISQSSGAAGGAILSAFADTTGTAPLVIRGLSGATDVTDTDPMIQFRCGERSGTGIDNLDTGETCFQVANGDNTATFLSVTPSSLEVTGTVVVDAGTETGQITLNGDRGGCLMLRDTDDAGWTECDALDGTLSCSIDADGLCD